LAVTLLSGVQWWMKEGYSQPLVGISVLSFHQCFDTVDWLRNGSISSPLTNLYYLSPLVLFGTNGARKPGTPGFREKWSLKQVWILVCNIVHRHSLDGTLQMFEFWVLSTTHWSEHVYFLSCSVTWRKLAYIINIWWPHQSKFRKQILQPTRMQTFT